MSVVGDVRRWGNSFLRPCRPADRDGIRRASSNAHLSAVLEASKYVSLTKSSIRPLATTNYPYQSAERQEA